MTTPTDDRWTRIRAELQRAVPRSAWELWLSRLQLRDIDGANVVLSAPDGAARWMAGRFGRVLQTSAAVVLGPEVEVDVIGHSTPLTTPGRPTNAKLEAGLKLHPDYTFDQFVIGEGNRLAHAAALAVAETPGHAYNPLFLCGPPGVGKTHLLHSIAAFAGTHGGAVVRCVTADSFTTDFVQAVRRDDVHAFKAAYRNVEILLVDDVQFLQDKTRTEEEFFHTFNALYETGAQLVLTSDRPPHDIQALEQRLRERFAAGLVAELATPDLETKVTILRRWSRQEGLVGLDDEALEELASHVTGNVRTLYGALTTVLARSSLYRRAVDRELVRHTFASPDRPAHATRPSIRDIQDAVCEAFSISLGQLVSTSRDGRVAWPRQLAMYLAREHTGATLPAIGREFGGRDHSTVSYAWRAAGRRLPRDHTARRAATQVLASARSRAADRHE